MPYCNRPQGSEEIGTCLRKFSDTGLRCDGSMRLPTKPPVRLRCVPPLHAGEAIAVKSPFSIACVGTKLIDVGGLLFSIRPWYPPKTNSLFLMIGAPMVPPNWLRLRLSRSAAKKLRELKR